MGKLSVSDKFVVRKIAGETVIVPLIRELKDSVDVFTLNETGSTILESIESGGEGDNLINSFVEKYPDISPEQLSSDISECLKDMRGVGLIVEEDTENS